MGSIFKLTALAGVAAGAYAVVKKFAPNILPDKNEAEDMAKNAINSVKLTFPTDEKYSNGTALTPPMAGRAGTLSETELMRNLFSKQPKP